MDSVKVGKRNLVGSNELGEVFEKLLGCLPSYVKASFFLDIVRKHDCFDHKHNKEFDLIIFGTGIPEELIYASGAKPYWILGGSRSLSAFADDSVPRDTDPVSRATLGCLQNDTADFPRDTLILVPLINDSSRKLAYILKAKGHPVHTIYIPPTQGKAAENELCRQGEACAEAIYKHTGNRITKQGLQKAQTKIAEARKQIHRFMQLTCDKSKLFPSVWRMLILHSYYCADDLSDWANHLRALNQQIASTDTRKNTENTSSILLLGSPIYFPNYKIPFLIHEVKLDIAVHLDYTVERFLRPYHAEKALTIETLMQSFYKKDCSSAYALNKSLFESVARTLAEMQIDGVVYHVLKGQIEYDFELERLEELFSTHSIPICRLETDYNYQDIEQLRIRMEAFGEVLTQRKFRKEALTR